MQGEVETETTLQTMQITTDMKWSKKQTKNRKKKKGIVKYLVAMSYYYFRKESVNSPWLFTDNFFRFVMSADLWLTREVRAIEGNGWRGSRNPR